MIWWMFKKETPEERVEKERQESSIQALQRGELPLRSRERINKIKMNGAKMFTSDFSCNELLLVEEAGYEPISQVMGSAFVNVSIWGSSPTGIFGTGRTTGELSDRTNSLIYARF